MTNWVEMVVFVVLFLGVHGHGLPGRPLAGAATAWTTSTSGGSAAASSAAWITWFLVGGDLYTAYTFVAVPALLFGAGAIGFFALPYTVILYPLVFLPVLRLWSVSRVHGYVTPADFVRGRYGSPLLALHRRDHRHRRDHALHRAAARRPRGGAPHDGAQRGRLPRPPAAAHRVRRSWPSTPTSPACGRPR